MVKSGFGGLKRGFRGLKSGLRELACVNHTRKPIISKPWSPRAQRESELPSGCCTIHRRKRELFDTEVLPS